MKEKAHFSVDPKVIGFPLLFTLLIWVVYWFEIRFDFDFNYLGVDPRTWLGLRGIVFSPFVHGDLSHLWHNTLPLLILTAALFFFYPKNVWFVLGWGVLGTGLLTWMIGRPSYHIGASGVIYMLFGFLFFKGIFARHYRLMALSFLVIFIYGSMVWYLAPIDPKISWEGHSAGFLIGISLALIVKKGIEKPKKYIWEQPDYNEEEDEFLKHFDENGNFIEHLPEEPELKIIEEENLENLLSENSPFFKNTPSDHYLEIRYTYKPKNSPEDN
ncbi:rhomboid family intramembrane serine protease [Aquimarina sp. ERC-38]|uniref:rhomboid family intramembrane serine protease n=1 Tax=Aquimarina sp. ERC-38 TaxID=2949996 RepID=UPI0022485073|nr:rhomboid family intramembrane serine protease [Aquimarina sp. ERC-38]UZO80961.1 rhomboid family intramembrane serine protease [Aquimarina sp. ERC-38]